MTNIINVSNRLPVTVGETIKKSSGGLVTALEGVSGKDYALKWIGWPGGEIPEDDKQNFEMGVWTCSAELIDAVLEQFNALWEGRRCGSCRRKDVCPVPLEEPGE